MKRFTWTIGEWQAYVEAPEPSRKYANNVVTGKAVKLLDAKPGDLVLNAGCGFGREVGVIFDAAPRVRVIGVDRSVEMLEAASESLKSRFHFEVSQCSIESLPFADETFDKVICLGVLMHVSDEPAALTEMLRVLKPGGILIATFNSLLHPLSPVIMAYNKWVSHNPLDFKQSRRLPSYYSRRLKQHLGDFQLHPGSFAVGLSGPKGQILLPLWRIIDKYVSSTCPWATYEPILYYKKDAPKVV